MADSEDKVRMAELGRGLLSLCVLLLVLAVMGLISLSIVWNASKFMVAELGSTDEMIGAIRSTLILTGFVPALYLVSAAALFYSNSRVAIWLTIGAVLFANFRSLVQLAQLTQGTSPTSPTIWLLVDLTILVGIIGYLLTSKDVERVYKFGARHFLTVGLRDFWHRGRGRRTHEQSEAVRLDETFK
jgi:hypothetical protein